MAQIPVVDLFAGPGGLGEGFATALDRKGNPRFKIHLSIEKDNFAHSTLELRSFFRQFVASEVPEEYYQFLRGEICREDLFRAFPLEAQAAMSESWLAELGATPETQIADRVKKALGRSDPWVLIGGPPCQAYSVVGRARNRGVGGYIAEKDNRQTLYLEYLKIIARHWPAVFVMENVTGLISAKLNGASVFDRICSDLRSPAQAAGARGLQGSHRYQLYSLTAHGKLAAFTPFDFIIRTEDHGIPQARHRIVLFGVREDYGAATPETIPFRHQVGLGKAIRGLPRLRSGLSNKPDTPANWLCALRSAEARRWLAGTKRMAGVDVHNAILDTLADLTVPRKGRGGSFVPGSMSAEFDPDWFLDRRLGGVCNHQTKAHMESDLHRYLFASCFGQVRKRSPRLRDFPPDLMPNHANASDAAELASGMFGDRFRVQLPLSPATTITSHIHKDGHYYIHYDPSQCRSLTVREAARIQTFPDNYFFCGARTQQFLQVGNAVPPLLARDIAAITSKVLE